METILPNNEIPGPITRGLWWIKSLPENLKKKIIEVASNAKKVGHDDPRRIIHSLKVGLALTLVSLFYYFRPVYDSYGDSAIWAVLTVVVVFEFTVGATLGKCINRGLGTLLAGALGVGAQHFAILVGEKEEPAVLCLLVFLLAAGATFSRFFPIIKARYDYGVVIFILTFSLVAVSGYRVDQILELAHQRLSTVLVGCLICIIISIAVFPVWAGEDLHNLVALHIEKLAYFLQGFGGEYFSEEGDNGSSRDKSFLKEYTAVLDSKTYEELLANFAGWEPCHGRFSFGHPWKQYLKVGMLTRKCAYQVEALNIYINSKLQVPIEFKKQIQDACTKMSSETGKALRELASGIRKMQQETVSNFHVANSKAAADDLKNVLIRIAFPENTDLSHIIPAATVSSLLVKVVNCTEELVDSVHELSRLGKFRSGDATDFVSTEIPQPHLLHRGAVNPFLEVHDSRVVITVANHHQFQQITSFRQGIH